jgi:hypothetical protein
VLLVSDCWQPGIGGCPGFGDSFRARLKVLRMGLTWKCTRADGRKKPAGRKDLDWGDAVVASVGQRHASAFTSLREPTTRITAS